MIAVLAAAGCDGGSPEGTSAAAPVTTATERDGIGPVPTDWVEARAEASERRLTDSPAGALVWRSIEAHGGLKGWLAHGTVEFEFDYAPVGDPAARRHSFQEIDLWSSRGRHRELGENPDAEFGFDGDVAWITPSVDAFPSPPDFWTMTPYYFLGIPFVMADPGTRFERLEDAPLGDVTHRLVKVTFDPGTGDAPDDYYVLYIHPETFRIGGLRYVVSYPGFFPEGGHTPEKLMVYGEYHEVGGLLISQRYDTYAWDAAAGVRGAKVTDVSASRVRLGRRYPKDAFDPPEGSVRIP
ncbi:MAG: hypothetical protein ACF8XB_07530 [Planctomycetota bacterium JB042]